MVRTSSDVSNSSSLVAENKFVAKGKMEILVGVKRVFCPELGIEEVMSPGKVLF